MSYLQYSSYQGQVPRKGVRGDGSRGEELTVLTHITACLPHWWKEKTVTIAWRYDNKKSKFVDRILSV